MALTGRKKNVFDSHFSQNLAPKWLNVGSLKSSRLPSWSIFQQRLLRLNPLLCGFGQSQDCKHRARAGKTPNPGLQGVHGTNERFFFLFLRKSYSKSRSERPQSRTRTSWAGSAPCSRRLLSKDQS